MARAFLSLDEGLKTAFIAAQEDSTVRWLRAGVQDEKAIVLASQGSASPSVQQDFDGLQDAVDSDSPAILLFREAAEGAGSGKWLLIAWVPDASRTRLKMLYSSSKADVKEGLGLGYFGGEYYASEPSELSYAALLASRDTTHDGDLLTEREVIQKEMARQARDITAKSTAMGVIPFEATDELRRQLDAFKAGTVNWVGMAVTADGAIGLGEARTVDVKSSLAPHVDAAEPRFYLLQHGDTAFFVYSCPEGAPVRLKMTYSTARASVVAAVAAAGTDCSKSFECGGPEEIDEALAYELKGVADGANAGALSAAADAPLPSKPSRPGRGRGRLTAKRP